MEDKKCNYPAIMAIFSNWKNNKYCKLSSKASSTQNSTHNESVNTILYFKKANLRIIFPHRLHYARHCNLFQRLVGKKSKKRTLRITEKKGQMFIEKEYRPDLYDSHRVEGFHGDGFFYKHITPLEFATFCILSVLPNFLLRPQRLHRIGQSGFQRLVNNGKPADK